MTQILITSSVLIVALVTLRALFQKRLDPRLQYALWALVLLRLLVPGSLSPWDHSVLTATAPVERTVAENVAERSVYLQPVGKLDLSAREGGEAALPGQELQTGDSFGYTVVDLNARSATRYAVKLSLPQFLERLWKTGMVAMGLWFLLTNLLFWRRLSKCRTRWEGALPLAVRQRVYTVPEGVIASPCLFGGAIYLPPKAAADDETLSYVLRHETTHARHLDPLWSLLRCVCLVVYWFDPLVWLAAHCAKADCELACDRSVMDTLGQAGRIDYGKTLLSLIPVKATADPFLSATTMTSGKRQLRRRIDRIARGPKRAVAITLTVVLLLVFVSACAFTGEVSGKREWLHPGTAQSLTGQELAWFNDVFFGNGEAETMPTQFANPWILYDDVRDIDLQELFYLEGEELSVEETAARFGGDLGCPAYGMTTEEMDRILQKYTATAFAENRRGLMVKDGVWYWAHGDTNYCGRLCFLCGTREETDAGTVVKLYHNAGSFAGGQWYCVTLSEEGAGEMRERSYFFRSNQTCDPPVIPTPLPEGEPEAVLSLDGARECVPTRVEFTPRAAGDFGGGWEDRLANWDLEGHIIQIYRATDGVIRAATLREDGTRDVFLEGLNDEADLFFYRDLFGQTGFFIYHSGQYDEHSWGPVYDYYYFAGGGELMHLAQTPAHFSEHMVLDADGDGAEELVCGRYLYFVRNGKIYEADLSAMLARRFPELGIDDDFMSGYWDPYGRYCEMMGTSAYADPGRGGYLWRRYLYYDGEDILVYKVFPQTVDHMTEGADWTAPGSVAAAVKDHFASHLEEQADGTWRPTGTDSPEPSYPIDDWRVASISDCHRTEVEDAAVACWNATLEYHTPQPEKVVLAGGNYVVEDGWAYGGNRWFYFGETAEGYELLWSDEQDASPGSEAFEENIRRQLSAQ